MKKITLLFLLIANVFFATAQSSPKREMRSAWLATVYRLDWPNTVITSTGNEASINMQKNRLITILDKLKATNLNTVFFQVRSRADAMYKSSYEPWSADLVSERGMDPGYDPLQFAIEEAHKRGMELHVWVNPYRFESSAGQWAGKPGDYATTNPDWVLKVGTATILDPGNPLVRQRIVDIVEEIVQKYDIDGVAFDDYFYLQGIKDEDSKSVMAHKPPTMPLADWRRSNVDQMVADVHAKIKSIKPYVQFGVSPAGIWTNRKDAADKYGVDLPQNINAGYAYDGIYCDPLAWMKAKTVDYISPQIYWPTGHPTASYTTLSQWWSTVASQFDVQFYSSHSLSEIGDVPRRSLKIDGETIPSEGLSQLEVRMLAQRNTIETRATAASDYLQQVKDNRRFDLNGAPGSVFYSVAKIMFTDRLTDYLTTNVFQNKAIRPALWSAHSQEEFVTNVTAVGANIAWNYSGAYPRFAVYAIPNAEVSKVGNFAKSDYLLDIVYAASFAIPADKPISDYTYAVTVIDRFNNEFSPKIIGNETLKIGTPTSLTYPANGGKTILPHNLEWTAQPDAEFYILEIASDASFNSIMYKREITDSFFSTVDLKMLKDEQTYYWRVITRRVSTTDAVTPANSFTPTRFNITSPANGETEVSTTPTIKWNEAPAGTKFKLEIASQRSFASVSMVYSKEDISTTELAIQEDILNYNAKYYLRVTYPLNDKTVSSDIVEFDTKVMIPSVPVFLAPVNNANVTGDRLNISWTGSEYASGYRVELHTKATFLPLRETVSKVLGASELETFYTNLKTGEYYIRVRSTYGVSSYTDWSTVNKVNFVFDPSSINEEAVGNGGCYISSNGNETHLVINSDSEAVASASLYTVSGVKIADILQNATLPGGQTEILIPSHKLLAKGVYVVRLSVNSKVYSLKLVN